MKAYLFPGQGSQFMGMGKQLVQANAQAKALFEQADDILGFSLSQIMFEGSDEDLRQTKVTQPAIFLHSIAIAQAKGLQPTAADVAAGHSLGEFSALTFAGALTFEDALRLVYQRALAMQAACEAHQGTMAAIMTNDNAMVEEVCAKVQEGIVVAANYNNPGQLVISGSLAGVQAACAQLTELKAKAIPLSVGGAFHSPLMQPAQDDLQKAIEATNFQTPICPVYQNVNAQAVKEVEAIRQNLIQQLTAPVRWQQSLENMLAQGFADFVEIGGKGNILLGMLKKVNRQAQGSFIGEE